MSRLYNKFIRYDKDGGGEGNPTDNGTGPKAGDTQPTTPTFSAEQQAFIDSLVGKARQEGFTRGSTKTKEQLEAERASAQAAAEAAALEEQKKYKELAEKTAKEKEEALARLAKSESENNAHRLKDAFRRSVSRLKLSFVNPEAEDDAFTHIKNAGLEFAEDGSVTGLDDAINKLKESRSYLFGTAKTSNINSQEGNGSGIPPQVDKEARERDLRSRYGVHR
jgi:hypothetical protein